MISLNKPSLSERLSQEARALPGKSHGWFLAWFRTWFRKVWDVRGGGLYACGFAATFLWLEAGSFIDDFKQIHLLFDGQIIGFILNFIIDSFQNTIAAFMWPVDIVELAPPFGAIGLGLAFWLFPIHIKKHIDTWLFDTKEDEEPEQPL